MKHIESDDEADTQQDFYERFLAYIDSYATPEQALKIAQAAPMPRRYRRAKKHLLKLIRRYIFLMAHPDQIAIQSRHSR